MVTRARRLSRALLGAPLLTLCSLRPLFIHHVPQVSGKYNDFISDQLEEEVSVSNISAWTSDEGKVQK